MFEDIQTYRCPSCHDIILIVLPGDVVDETEFNAKVSKHERDHEAFAKEFNG